MLFTESDGSQTDPLIKARKYWSQALMNALQLHQDGGFPIQLSPFIRKKTQKSIPAVGFSEEINKSTHIGDVFNKELKIYVTPTEFFTTKFREIFNNTQIKFTTSKYARKWLGGPHMSFWPQQLNFALWCATTGCGVSRDILFPTGYLGVTLQIRSFYLFHVYYTVRCILYEMGEIESVAALPDDSIFKQKDNKYNVAAYKKICGEFGIDPSSDFRFTHGQNYGLGYVNILYSDGDFAHKKWTYPPADLSNPSSQRFGDEGGTDAAGNKIDFIRNDQGADKQFEHFVPNFAQGLTRAGLARINASIEAFIYCVLGSQANTRSSIPGSGGRARETQKEFLNLIESAIRVQSIQESIVRYNNSIEETKTRLDFAVAQGAWLMPPRMIINTESIVGYNNNLREADETTKLGVNNHINLETHKASLKLMAGGPSKINPPNSHPSNPIHKQATEAQGLVKKKPTQTKQTDSGVLATKTDSGVLAKQTPATDTSQELTTDPVHPHHVNKALVAFGLLALVGLIMILFLLLFGEFFNQERRHEKDKKPSVFAKK